jgi:hypothetical protein
MMNFAYKWCKKWRFFTCRDDTSRVALYVGEWGIVVSRQAEERVHMIEDLQENGTLF